jgi:HPt (histidine-containing phosphotransfer) domain-containing protein
MTAYSMKEDRDRFMSQGMDDYMAKPIRAQRLIGKVQEVIGAAPNRQMGEMQRVIAQEMSLPVLDRSIVNQLMQIGGMDLVLSVYDDFVTESNDLVSEALIAYENGDIARVKSNLHTLKGSAGTVGVMQVAEIAMEAEACLKTDDTSTLSEALPKLQLAYGKFLENHKNWLEEWL